MTESASWYLALAVVGAGGLLPAAAVFQTAWSGGALFARPLALLVLGVAVWLTTAVTPVPYGQTVVIVAVAMLWLGTALLAWRQPELLRVVWRRRRLLASGELLFATLFLALAIVRAQTPAAFGNEKPMEMMLLTAVHHTERMPPSDPWFAGAAVAYYHLGYLSLDIVSRLAGLIPGQAFNLGLATVGAMAGAGVLGLAGDVASLTPSRRAATPWIAGGVAVVSLLFLAPIQGFFDLLWNHRVGTGALWARLGVEHFPGPPHNPGIEPKGEWWWWHPTRVIPDTITEFPAFSLLLGDLHPHVLALPIGVVALAFAVNTTVASAAAPGWRYWASHRLALLMGGVIFAGLYMTNAWDVLSYGLIWFVVALLQSAAVQTGAVRIATSGALHVILPAALAVLFAAPFIAGSSTPLEGVGLVVRGSDPVRFGLVWVPIVIPLIVAAVLLRPGPQRTPALIALTLGATAVAAWAAAAVLSGNASALSIRSWGWLVIAVLIVVGSWSAGAAIRAHRGGDSSGATWLALLAASCTIVLVTELTYLVESFHFGTRVNTVFKLWFVVWLLLAVAGGVAVAQAAPLLRRSRPGTRAGLAAMLALYLVALPYAPGVVDSRVREWQEPATDALAFHEELDPDLAEAIQWVSTHLGEDDLLLESVGDSHTYSNVVSQTTHAATVLGWLQHELIWRGRLPEISQRWALVHAIYLEGATAETRRVAREYGVTHIYLGAEEIEIYGPEVTERFAAWPTVFESGETRIVEVPPERTGDATSGENAGRDGAEATQLRGGATGR